MIKIALIGVGRWGKNILHTLQDMPEVDVMVGHHADVDGVVVATPGSTHAAIALPYIKQCIPTFIEKPLTIDPADARRLKAAAKKHHTPVSVGHIHLHNPAFIKTKQLVPKLGKVHTLQFAGTGPGPVRDDMSVLWDWGPHPVSMALNLLGKKPQSVQAWGELILNPRYSLHDIVTMKLTFPNQVSLICHLSWLSPIKQTRLTVTGSQGSLVFDDRAEKKITHYTSDGRVRHPRYSGQLPLTLELQAFINTITTGQPTNTDIHNGAAIVTILAAADQSIHRQGAPVAISFR